MTELTGVTYRAPRVFQPLSATAADYAGVRPDTQVNWSQQYWYDALEAQLAGFSGAGPVFDLVVIDHPWVGEFAANGWLAPLDDLADDAVVQDADPASLASYRWAGRQWALPVDAACQMVVFRPDLVGQTTVPPDWDSLFDLAAELHDPPRRYAFANTWTPLRADPAGATPHGHGVAGFLMVLSIAHALGEQPYAEPGYRLPLEVAERAFGILEGIWKYSIPREEMRGLRVDEFLSSDDRVAIGPATFPFITNHRTESDRPLVMAPMPTLAETGRHTTALGGTGLAISARSGDVDAARQYARYVMDPAVQSGTYLAAGGQPGSRRALHSPPANEPYRGFGAVLADGLIDCYTRPCHPGWRAVEEAANAVVLRHLMYGEDLRDTVGEINAIADRSWERERG